MSVFNILHMYLCPYKDSQETVSMHIFGETGHFKMEEDFYAYPALLSHLS